MAAVLLVEDDELIRVSLAMLLEAEGYQVHEAANGKEALDVLEGSAVPPCIILLDLMMPVMDGMEFRRRQLGSPRFAGVPVAILTGRADVNAVEALAPAAIFRKPFQFETVCALVRVHCQGSAAVGDR